jgi:hypothetical protein
LTPSNSAPCRLVRHSRYHFPLNQAVNYCNHRPRTSRDH